MTLLLFNYSLVSFYMFIIYTHKSFNFFNFSNDILVDILTKPKNALVKQYQKLMEMDGAKLTFEDEALKLIAREAIQRKTGARGLRSILERIMRNVMFEVPSVGGSTMCTVTSEDVKLNQEPKLRVNPKRVKKTANG